jgi:hypothetical protein
MTDWMVLRNSSAGNWRASLIPLAKLMPAGFKHFLSRGEPGYCVSDWQALLPERPGCLCAAFGNHWERIGRQDIRAAAHPREGQPIRLQLGVGLFDRDAVHAQVTRQLAAGRQACIRCQAARKNALAQMIFDLLVKGHGALPVQWDAHG